MTPTSTPQPFLSVLALVLMGIGCGEDEPDETVVEVTSEVGEVQGLPTGPAAEGCMDFCVKSNACAERAGRPVPPSALDCEEACAPAGIYATAPASMYVCAERECGPAFRECTQEAMLEHMHGSDLPFFPLNCVGLCNRVAYCDNRLNEESEVPRDACEASCRPGGAFHALPEAIYLCANVSCGVPLARCRAGEEAPSPPTEPPASGPTMAPAAGSTSP